MGAGPMNMEGQLYVKTQYKILLCSYFNKLVQSLSHVPLCHPMDCSTPSFLHHLLKFAHALVHWVNDAIHPFHPLSSPSPPALNLPEHQDLFQWVGSSHQVAKFSFSISPSMNTQGWFPCGLTSLISLLSKELSKVFSSTTVGKHQFLGAQPSLWSNSHPYIWLLEKP